MLLEVAEIEVRPGAEDTFASAMRETGIPALADCEGVVSVRFGRGVENPSKFTFNVVWTSMEAHMAARTLEGFGTFRAAMGDMTAGGAMSHYVMDEAVAGVSA